MRINSFKDINDDLLSYNRYAQIAELYGGTPEQVEQVSEDVRDLNLGKAIGGALGAVGGYVFGSQINASNPNHNYSIRTANVLGTGVGAGLGALLGDYLVYKNKTNNRNINRSYRPTYVLNNSQAAAALQNLPRKVQHQWDDTEELLSDVDYYGPIMAKKFADRKTLKNFLQLHKLNK